ncbi:MAG: DegQ family serine endoprotease [Proteobacteria bacterium]|nr:DegQ family serine endoprotease [Desulfobacula sp.]MBU0973769.1 DegQ family serine endoprotease [Pseudomonadota bacterium]
MKITAATDTRTFTDKFIISAATLFLILVLSSFFWIPRAIAKSTIAPTIPESFSSLAKEASPAVINIRTVKTIQGGGPVFRHFFNGPNQENDPRNEFYNRFYNGGPQREFKQPSLGSGFIIDKKGYIVTNNHVVDNADEIRVTMNDGKEFEARILGRDPKTDLALIKIETETDLPTIEFGDSDLLDVGQWVVAIGSPFGLEHTVTAGIVSAKGRVLGSGPYDDFIQTDASINPGNSGGPLLNMAGEVVGINTAIIRDGQGIGFAIPVNLAKKIIGQLKDSGEVTRGWLGVVIQDLNEDMAKYYGVNGVKGALVTDLVKGDPADQAGIEPNDIIIEVDGIKIETSRDLTREIAGIDVGKKIELLVLRGGNEKNLTVQIAKRNDSVVSESGIDWIGIEIVEITKEDASKYDMIEKEGVLVNKIQEDSKAEVAGMWPGDIIKEINNHPINTTMEYYKAVNSIKKDESLRMLIKRRNKMLMVFEIKK